jgi:hypothetical protein
MNASGSHREHAQCRAPRSLVAPWRVVAAAVIGMVAAALPAPPAGAVTREVVHEFREAYEGRALQLRYDLDSAMHALEPNVFGLGGMGHGRENGQVLFYALETVYIDRVMSEGGSRLTLTIFRSSETAQRLKSQAVPPPITGIPTGSQSIATYASSDSTAVALELQAGKKDPEAQRREIETLFGRLFYVDSKPTQDDLTRFVAAHRDWPVSRLTKITGLDSATVKDIIAALGP